MLNDLDGAAEAYREALDGAPDDPIALSALEAIEERREDWSTLQEVLMRRLGATFGADQVAVLLKLARNAEQKLSDADQAIGFLRQIVDADPTQRLRVSSSWSASCARTRAGTTWSRCWANTPRWKAKSGRKPTELALRVAIADVWEKELDSPDSAAEALEKVLEVAPDERRRRCCRWRGCTRARSAGRTRPRRWSARRRTPSAPAEIAEIQYRNAQILTKQEADPVEIERALLRALDADPTHRATLEALEKIARDAKDDERLVQLLELGLEVASDDDERRAPAARDRGALRRAARAIRRRRCRTWSGWSRSTRRRSRGASSSPTRWSASGRIDDAARIMTELVAELTKARRGKDAARWHTRLGMLSEARGDMKGAADSFGAAYKLDPEPPRRRWRRSGRLAFRASDLEGARKYYRSLLLQNFDEKTAGVSKAEVYLMLGRMHVLANEIPKARNMFERGLEVDPDNVDLKAAIWPG